MAKETLTAKQKRFCEEYIRDWNGTRAAIAAGYSKATARQIATTTLSKVYIQDYIEEIQKDFRKQANISFLSQVERIEELLNDDENTTREKMDAIKELNKMFGFYATEKKQTDLTSNGEKITGFNIVISDKTS